MPTWTDQGRENSPLRVSRDRKVAVIARRQHGLVTRSQLYELGFVKDTIRHRVSTGRLHEVRRNVYAVGTARLVGHAPLAAAVLTCGEGAVVSHQSAGAVWDVLPSPSQIHITTIRGLAKRSGINFHRVRTLHPADRTELHGIPVTSLPRTLLDLAEVVSFDRLERAVENAERLQLFDLNAMTQVMAESYGRHGLRPFSMLLSKHMEPARTRSELEREFFSLVEEAGLPRPHLNVVVAGFEVDVLWPEQRLIVELDGYAFHRTRAAFERDRVRDAQLQLAGYRVLRITHRMLRSVMPSLRALLAS